LNELYVSDDDEFSGKAEQIIGFAISFFYGLLENPSIWVSDVLLSEKGVEESSSIEKFFEEQVFIPNTVHTILRIIVSKYLIYTKDEL